MREKRKWPTHGPLCVTFAWLEENWRAIHKQSAVVKVPSSGHSYMLIITHADWLIFMINKRID